MNTDFDYEESVINEMAARGFELGEDEDCVRFEHENGSDYLEFDTMEDAWNYLQVKEGES